MRPAGFFPKVVAPRPAYLPDPRVEHIRSVSECTSAGPPGWIDAWEHNDLGFYDTVDTARAIGARPCEAPFEIHGYRAAVDFSAGGGEPGPYHVIEVWSEPAATL